MTAPGPPYEALPPDAPATVEDVRTTRRWTWVAFAWAIAASVIAVIALIQAAGDNTNDNTPTQPTDVAGQLNRFESQANNRLDQFSRRLNNTAAEADVAKLDKRLSKAEDDLSKLDSTTSDQADTLKLLRTDVDDLTKRVGQLEKQQQSQTQTGTTTTP